MRAKGILRKGKIKVFKTLDHRPIGTLAVRSIKKEGHSALIIDGTARIDPYWMMKVSKKEGLQSEKILKTVIIGRGFTAYQMEDMIMKVSDMLESKDICFLGLIGLSERFSDDDIEEEEGRWNMMKCVRHIKKMTENHQLYSAAADTRPYIFKEKTGLEDIEEGLGIQNRELKERTDYERMDTGHIS